MLLTCRKSPWLVFFSTRYCCRRPNGVVVWIGVDVGHLFWHVTMPKVTLFKALARSNGVCVIFKKHRVTITLYFLISIERKVQFLFLTLPSCSWKPFFLILYALQCQVDNLTRKQKVCFVIRSQRHSPKGFYSISLLWFVHQRLPTTPDFERLAAMFQESLS